MTTLTHLGLTGRVTVQVINGGQVVSTHTQRNLWLDQGLNNLAAFPLCQLFEVAVKGTGTTATSEDLTGTANTYSIANGSSAMTRTAGSRDFTVNDVGRLIRFTDNREFLINGYTSATQVSVSPSASSAVTNLKAKLYYVGQVGLDEEIGRTNSYSQVAGENGTTTAAATRTFKRTFVFDGEDTVSENIPSVNTYSQTGDTVTRVNGSRDFTSDDVGKTLQFLASGNSGQIVSVDAVDAVTVSNTADNPEGNIKLTGDSGLYENVSGTYSRSADTITRVSGTRDFTADDIGKIVHFNSANVEATITAVTDASNATVDVSGTLAVQTIRLYGFQDYSEFGFSHLEDSGDNLNIRSVLSSPARAYRSTLLRASDQLKVTYECQLTVSPATSIAGNLTPVSNDPGNQMSGNKSGTYTIETFATSTVQATGETDTSLIDLEPSYEGFAALSTTSDALAPLSSKTRTGNTVSVAMVGDTYTQGMFTRLFTATFGLNDAIGDLWRSLMIFDPDSSLAIFTFLFAVNQKKDGSHVLTVRFRKNWGRDLST